MLRHLGNGSSGSGGAVPVIRDVTTGDRIQLGAVFGLVERIVHYGGAFDVRIAIRQADGTLHWSGANYGDRCKRLRATQSDDSAKPVRRYSQIRDRLMAGR